MRYVPVKYALVLVGDGELKHILRLQVLKYGLSNVFFLDKVSKSCVSQLIKESDVCVISAQNSPLYKYGVSMNKLFDYMLEAKPVLFAIDSPNNVIEQSGSGLVVSSGLVNDISTGMEQLAKMNDEEKRKMGLLGRQFVLKHHSFSILSKKLLLALNNI